MDQYAVNYLLMAGFSKARLSVAVRNKHAYSYYKKMGWVELEKNQDDGETILMEKQLG